MEFGPDNINASTLQSDTGAALSSEHQALRESFNKKLDSAARALRDDLLRRENQLGSFFLGFTDVQSDFGWLKDRIEITIVEVRARLAAVKFSVVVSKTRATARVIDAEAVLSGLTSMDLRVLVSFLDKVRPLIEEALVLKKKIDSITKRQCGERDHLAALSDEIGELQRTLERPSQQDRGSQQQSLAAKIHESAQINEVLIAEEETLSERQARFARKVEFLRHCMVSFRENCEIKLASENTASCVALLEVSIGSCLREALTSELPTLLPPPKPRKARLRALFKRKQPSGSKPNHFRVAAVTGAFMAVIAAVLAIDDRRTDPVRLFESLPTVTYVPALPSHIPTASDYLRNQFVQRYFTDEQKKRIGQASAMDLPEISKQEVAKIDSKLIYHDLVEVLSQRDGLMFNGDLQAKTITYSYRESTLAKLRDLFGSEVKATTEIISKNGVSEKHSRKPASDSTGSEDTFPLSAICAGGQLKLVVDILVPYQKTTLSFQPKMDLREQIQKLGVCK